MIPVQSPVAFQQPLGKPAQAGFVASRQWQWAVWNPRPWGGGGEGWAEAQAKVAQGAMELRRLLRPGARTPIEPLGSKKVALLDPQCLRRGM